MVQNADRTSQPIFSKYQTPTDWPWHLGQVIREARRILSYMENVPKEAMPPESIWHSPTKCRSWIDQHMSSGKGDSGGMLEFSDREIETK